MAEAEDLKSSKCGFDPHPGHSNHVLNLFIDYFFFQPVGQFGFGAITFLVIFPFTQVIV